MVLQLEAPEFMGNVVYVKSVELVAMSGEYTECGELAHEGKLRELTFAGGAKVVIRDCASNVEKVLDALDSR